MSLQGKATPFLRLLIRQGDGNCGDRYTRPASTNSGVTLSCDTFKYLFNKIDKVPLMFQQSFVSLLARCDAINLSGEADMDLDSTVPVSISMGIP